MVLFCVAGDLITFCQKNEQNMILVYEFQVSHGKQQRRGLQEIWRWIWQSPKELTLQRIQKGEGCYHCLFCPYSTNQLWHCKEHTIREQLPCPACGKICKDSVALRNHKRQAHKGAVWLPGETQLEDEFRTKPFKDDDWWIHNILWLF